MRAAVTVSPGNIRLEDRPPPRVPDGWAVVDVASVGVCAADVHLFQGDSFVSSYPHVQGHEIAAWVKELPTGYDGPLSPGTLVVVEPLLSCGECVACRRGRTNTCVLLQVIGVHVDGGLGGRLAVPVNLLHDAGRLRPAVAAFAEPVSIALQAIHRAQVAPTDTVLILGAGPIGQAMVMGALAITPHVAIADRLSERLDLAKTLGAVEVIDAGRQDLAVEAARITADEGPTVIFEATGASPLIAAATEIVAASGTIAVVGIAMRPVELNPLLLTQKEITIVGSRNNVGLFDDAIRLVTLQGEAVEGLISHRFPIERTHDALTLALEHPEETMKVSITVNEEQPRE